MGRNEGPVKAVTMNPMNAGKAPDDGRDIGRDKGRKTGQSDRPATAERRERQKPENTEPDRNGD